MTRQAKFQYLEDSRGVFGIGLEPGVKLTIRPDRPPTILAAEKALLHPMPRGWKSECLEKSVWGNFASLSLDRAFKGQAPWKIRGAPREQQRKYWAAKHGARKIFNGMWRCALVTAADQKALHLARRFQPSHRWLLYWSAATSERARQLIEAFPALGVQLYANVHESNPLREMQAELRAMVERGQSMRTIAELAAVPWCTRKLKPWAASYFGFVEEFARNEPDAFNAFVPPTTIGQTRWVRGICVVRYLGGDNGLTAWAAKHMPLKLKANDLGNELTSIRDWYMADPHEAAPKFSWETAKKRADEWHRTIAVRNAERFAAQNAETARRMVEPFPPPWLPGDTLGSVEIVPLLSHAALVQDGVDMHHCVGSYAWQVRSGRSYIYSIREGGKPKATLELGRDGGLVVRQLRAACNQPVEPKIASHVSAWLRKHGKNFDPEQYDLENANEIEIPF